MYIFITDSIGINQLKIYKPLNLFLEFNWNIKNLLMY